ncbi:MAG TPA: alpha/beta hydrolase, partial [Ilumatobacteraceae bacterium]|nr:alpha/beta hydrolase [Ilumatobacteraceae bacterium]
VASKVWRSKRYTDLDVVRAEAGRAYDRSFYPEGAMRQMAAIQASGSRSAALRDLDVATLVVHGRDDTLIPPAAGFRTAELIPGSVLLFVSDMGHDIPEPLWSTVTDAIVSHTNPHR